MHLYHMSTQLLPPQREHSFVVVVVFCFLLLLLLSWMFEHDWTHAVLGVLYACVLYFCVCTYSALSIFRLERCSRNMLIIIIIIIIV